MIDRACISLNHRCNLRCKYCHFKDKSPSPAEQGEMEFKSSEVESIIDNIAEYCEQEGMREFKLGIVGAGEPLLSFATLSAAVNRVKDRGREIFKTYTITNGVDLPERVLAFFKENHDVIDLNFSLDGYEKLHNALRQNFRATMDSIRRYEELFGRKPIINCTVSKQSVINQNELVRFFVENDFTHINFSIISDVSNRDLILSRGEYHAFLNKCEDAGIKMRQRSKTAAIAYDCTMYGKRCGVGRTNIFFTRAGIYPCGRFFGLAKYRMAEFHEKLSAVESKLTMLQDGHSEICYYETHVA